jgi:hypothetical protein
MKVHSTVPRFVTSVKESRKYIMSQAKEEYEAVLFEVLVSTGGQDVTS